MWEYTQSWPHSNATNVPCGDLLVMCMQGARGNARSEGPQLQRPGREEREPLRGLGLGLDEVVDDRVEEGACTGLKKRVRTLSLRRDDARGCSRG